MTASNGAVVWSAKYEAFGKAQVAPESTVVNNLRFPGQYYDGESGLHWNLWRYYDPGVGRYLRVDPINISKVVLVESLLVNKLKHTLLTNDLIIEAHLIRSLRNALLLFSFTIATPQQLNNYLYALNGPGRFIDPKGESILTAISIGMAIGGAINMAVEAYGLWVEKKEAEVAADKWKRLKNQDPCSQTRNNQDALDERQDALQDFLSESGDVIEKGGEMGTEIGTKGLNKITQYK